MSLYFLDFWRRFGLALGASGDWLPQLIEMSESLQLRQPFLLLPMTVMTMMMMMTLRLFPTSQHLRSSIVISATSWRQRPLARSLARRFISVTRRPRWARRDVALLSNAGWGWRFPCGRVAGAYSRHVWRPVRAGPGRTRRQLRWWTTHAAFTLALIHRLSVVAARPTNRPSRLR